MMDLLLYNPLFEVFIQLLSRFFFAQENNFDRQIFPSFLLFVANIMSDCGIPKKKEILF
jgi:hypothetical protein